MPPNDSEVLRSVEVTLARLEGKVDATLVDHSRRLSDLEGTVRAEVEKIEGRLDRKAKTLAGHEARIEDLEDDRASTLPRAAQGAGIITGVGALVLSVWTRIGV